MFIAQCSTSFLRCRYVFNVFTEKSRNGNYIGQNILKEKYNYKEESCYFNDYWWGKFKLELLYE